MNIDEPELVVHTTLRSLHERYRQEYGLEVKSGSGLLGFYGFKSNTIHLLADELLHRFLWAHEYAHYTQRRSFKMKYVTLLARYAVRLILGGIALFLFSFAFMLIPSITLFVGALAVGVIMLFLGGSVDSLNMRLEIEAYRTAQQQMEGESSQ